LPITDFAHPSQVVHFFAYPEHDPNVYIASLFVPLKEPAAGASKPETEKVKKAGYFSATCRGNSKM
jgi:hypothetical protein